MSNAKFNPGSTVIWDDPDSPAPPWMATKFKVVSRREGDTLGGRGWIYLLKNETNGATTEVAESKLRAG